MPRARPRRSTALTLCLAAAVTAGGFASASTRTRSTERAEREPTDATPAGSMTGRAAASPCVTAADCVPNAPCLATRCVNPRQRSNGGGCPDVVETTRLACACVRGRCAGRHVAIPGAGL